MQALRTFWILHQWTASFSLTFLPTKEGLTSQPSLFPHHKRTSSNQNINLCSPPTLTSPRAAKEVLRPQPSDAWKSTNKGHREAERGIKGDKGGRNSLEVLLVSELTHRLPRGNRELLRQEAGRFLLANLTSQTALFLLGVGLPVVQPCSKNPCEQPESLRLVKSSPLCLLEPRRQRELQNK